jgi:anti-sigma regulatory factor (Ser/Thr protein kinase)
MLVAAHSRAVLELEPATMANVSAARSFVRRTLGPDVPDEVAADLQLATSELVTNAYEHGAEAAVVVTVEVGDGCASVSVRSHQRPGANVAEVSEWSIADPEQLAGRGLGIVRAIADDLELTTEGSTLTIAVHRKW